MIKLLDHGYLKLIDTWGSDERIIESARMSTAKGFLGWGPRCKNCKMTAEDAAGGACDALAGPDHDWKPGDENLLRFLWENEHATPFEMAGITIEVKAPIMVFREWHRHRVPFGYNEMSARYVPLPNENYLPEVQDLIERSEAAAKTKNRQAAGTGKVIDEVAANAWLHRLRRVYAEAQEVYEAGLEWGVPKELARLPVPVARYSCMRATANLRGWLGFMRLRAAPSAQKEIRVYAEALGLQIIAAAFPRTWQLFEEARLYRPKEELREAMALFEKARGLGDPELAQAIERFLGRRAA